VTPEQKRGREDHSGWSTVTIDGENAQDFDDAVSIKIRPDGHYLLGVHIADVAEYVRKGTALDRNALRRGTSVYFPDHTLPMLPEKLSNGMCSLRPREDKLTLSVLLEIDPRGCVRDVDIHSSWIRTAERMTYHSVQKIIEGDGEERKKFASHVPDLMRMRDLSQLLRRKRIARGGLDFDMAEPELVYREGALSAVIPAETSQAHQIIEEFMVLANEAVARFLTSKGIPSLFRVHPKPLASDWKKLRELLSHFNIAISPFQKMSSNDLQSVLEHVRGKPEEKFITLKVLRSLRLAVYSDENYGHYGLAKKEYTHFTSPIRRYPDLTVHRLVRSAIEGNSVEGDDLTALASQCSQKERAAEEAERDLVEWRIYRFLKNKLGEEYFGTIVEFTKAGLIVELDDYFVDGLIFYNDLGKDYFVKKTEKVLSGRKTGRSFELGSRRKVTIVSVDPLFRRMSLMLSE
jgi:ribonuclease R